MAAHFFSPLRRRMAAALLMLAAPGLMAATVRIGEVTAQPGDTVEIPVFLEGVAGAALSVDITASLDFDASVLSGFNTVTAGAVSGQPFVFYSPQASQPAAGTVDFLLSAFFTSAVDVNGEVLRLSFDVAGAAPEGDYGLSLSLTELALDAVPDTGALATDGSLTVVPVPAALPLMLAAVPLVLRRRHTARGQQRTRGGSTQPPAK